MMIELHYHDGRVKGLNCEPFQEPPGWWYEVEHRLDGCCLSHDAGLTPVKACVRERRFKLHKAQFDARAVRHATYIEEGSHDPESGVRDCGGAVRAGSAVGRRPGQWLAKHPLQQLDEELKRLGAA